MFQRFLLLLTLLMCLPLARAESLLPLQDGDVEATCGCSFKRLGGREGPLLVWSSEGKQKGFVRAGDKLHRLDMRQHKRIPEREGSPRGGDRLVIFVASGTWQVQALGTVTGGRCTSKLKACTRYEGRLVVQHEGRNRTEIPASGECGCP